MTRQNHGEANETPPYAFGDVGLASARLELLNEVFAEPSRALLRVAPSNVALAIDLGCGPGFSTRQLAEELHPVHLAGLDTSEVYLQQARASGPDAEWHLHDVTIMPLPTGPVDVLHARFVLCHLPDPEHVLLAWLGQLKPGGYLLLLEDDEIRSTNPVLLAYERLARSLVAHRGADLWVGASLAKVVPPHGYRVLLNRLMSHEVPIPLAARLFSMNFSVWRHDPFVKEGQSARELDDLGRELHALAQSRDEDAVVFDLRQIAYRRE